ncbi:cytidine deaminase [Flavobacterium cerinum]|uniref:Cytidine deaminase n=1 Tax=Flavobacterium cerinum TaxID=2502784 RepID=A0ABY5J017_9FLAO|nr:cytidine deaminase [Flavobacterium cerinum]UUC46909.1 cytidine deaminase [Flavobacterium cerinum]
MKKIDVTTTFLVYDSEKELPEDVKPLMEQAVEIRKKAYAPYSRFKVGAAILLDNGKVVVGSNQENAAYPSGLCAERVAIFQAGALYPDAQIVKIAISATSEDKPVESPIPPCGACRQSIAEYEFKQEKPIELYFMGEIGEVYKSESLQNILPFHFDKKFL